MDNTKKRDLESHLMVIGLDLFYTIKPSELARLSGTDMGVGAGAWGWTGNAWICTDLNTIDEQWGLYQAWSQMSQLPIAPYDQDLADWMQDQLEDKEGSNG